MPRKIVAASLVALWLALFGFEFLEDIDFPDYFQLHKTAKAALVSLGEAIKVADDIQIIASKIYSAQPGIFYPCVYVSSQWFREETRFLKKDFKIYKLHRTFLI